MSSPAITRFGDYILCESLGKGAMGSVDLARPAWVSSQLPSIVVIKRMHTELADKDLFLKRFRHEGEAAVRIDSPYVAKVFDVGTVGTTAYIAMEFIDGFRLSEFLDTLVQLARLIPVEAAVELFTGLLLGLEALRVATDPTGRNLGFVHRDLSPKNLMVTDDGRIRVIDLGLGKSTAQDWKTRTGLVMGSPGYMSPEQALARPVDHRSDLYTAGIVLFELITLRRYIKRGTLPDVLARSAEPELVLPSSVRPDVPAAVDRILARALNPEPSLRFQSAKDFLAEVEGKVGRPRGKAGPIVQEVLAAERAKRRQQIEEILALPVEELDAPPEPTVVFARNSVVVRAFEDARRAQAQDAQGFEPTRIRSDTEPTRAWSRDTIPDASEEVAPTHLDEATRVDSEQTRAAKMRLEPRSGAFLAEAARPSGIPVSVVVGAVAVSAGLAFAAGLWVRVPSAEVVAPLEETPLGVTVKAGTSTTPARRFEPPKPPPRPEQPRPPERIEPKPSEVKPTEGRPSELKSSEPKPDPKRTVKPVEKRSADEIFKSIIARGQVILREHPDRSQRVQSILGDATLEAQREDSEEATKTLLRLESELSSLAQ